MDDEATVTAVFDVGFCSGVAAGILAGMVVTLFFSSLPQGTTSGVAACLGMAVTYAMKVHGAWRQLPS